MKTKRKMSSKTKKTLAVILMAIGSFLGGIIGVKNEAAGEVVEKVISAIGLGLTDNTTEQSNDSSMYKKDVNGVAYDTTQFVDTIVYTESPFTIVAFDTFTVVTKLNKMELPTSNK